jgi:hypothetical protein
MAEALKNNFPQTTNNDSLCSWQILLPISAPNAMPIK